MTRIVEKLRWYILAILFLATFVIWYAVIRENREDFLKMVVMSVGQGDAIYIEAPNGRQILVDGGPDRSVLSELKKAMPFYDRSIDVLVVSNPDQDHLAGLIDVLRSYKVDFVIEPGTKPDTNVYKIFESEILNENAKKILGRRSMKVFLDKNSYLEILFPDRDVSGLETNTGSIIAKLVYKNSRVLLMGDAPESIENYLVKLDGEGLESDVLKVGHHGSKTSSSLGFLGFVSPKYAAISVGLGNKYGHPNTEVLDRLNKLGIEIGRTDQKGALTYVSDGEKFVLK